MFNKDLIYICKCYEEWPSGVDSLLYSNDGEIIGIRSNDVFSDYPDGELKDPKNNDNFLAAEGHTCIGQNYTKEEFLACKEYLAKQETSVDDSTDPVVEQVKLRIQEITKRHEQALQDELKPLMVVLQRRVETL
ncbi:hypothetical protein AXI76_gp198 [Pseudoalteromonas phage H101]|uniref:Uncharacterized protein n=1 Tax=Pseudoalteromonas phage H101 TaxID=1654919 RepID=A0A0H4IND7_9CAUD|nr:hypothetical protein AXI76_gp198 [Pseudoalteromonas phage H101]AKO61099.1 hypothetical protein [Pseudoalteromonas phage H101]|tara:strand:- start:4374 stop:4775 length:402 start_codon:yes stop_codon:yes gene_type:complete